MSYKFFRLRWFSLLTLPWSLNLWAANEIPCFVFSGNSEKEYSIDLAKYNRVYFNENSFTITSSSDTSLKNIELLYSLFNHLEFKASEPTNESGMESVESGETKLLYLAGIKSLKLDSNEDKEFTVGIFDISGSLIISSKIHTNQQFELKNFAPGVYIAIATDGDSKHTLKIIIK